MLADTLSTLVGMPFNALMPEIVPGYDERTSLMGYPLLCSAFSRTCHRRRRASHCGCCPCQRIFPAAGIYADSDGFRAVGESTCSSLFSLSSAKQQMLRKPELYRSGKDLAYCLVEQALPLRDGMSLFTWSAVDMVGLILPSYLLYWVAQGDMLMTVNVLGVSLSLESAFLGLLMADQHCFHPILVMACASARTNAWLIYPGCCFGLLLKSCCSWSSRVRCHLRCRWRCWRVSASLQLMYCPIRSLRMSSSGMNCARDAGRRVCIMERALSSVN